MSGRGKNYFDQLRMLECLSLAGRGAGRVSPNPMVGAVVVKNGKVVGRGYHRRFGGPHAEVFAIRQAHRRANGATLYVNLEPCCHHGKTPPCTDLIQQSGIQRVVVGVKDPNPLVNGGSLKLLRASGIDIEVGILSEECRKLNEAFLKYVTTGLPFVTLKIAQSLDGKIADERGGSRWITNERSRTVVHALRSRYDAVLVGANTVTTDDPRLTVRMVKGRNPYRVVLDGNLKSPAPSRVFTDSARTRTILFTSVRTAKRHARRLDRITRRRVEVVVLDSNTQNLVNLQTVLRVLARKGIASILVEGGAEIFTQFLSEGLADKCIIFIAPKILGRGLPVFQDVKLSGLSGRPVFHTLSSWNLDGDLMVEAYLQKKKKFI